MDNGNSNAVKISISLAGDVLGKLDQHRVKQKRSGFISGLIVAYDLEHSARATLHSKVDEAVASGVNVEGMIDAALRKGAAA